MNKGFTLVELLGVLVILAVLAVVTVPLIQGFINDGAENTKNVQEDSFIKAAESWASNNVFTMPSAGSNKTVYLKTLIEEGYLEASKNVSGYYIKVKGSDKEYNLNSSYVKITNKGTSTKAKYEYEFHEVLK